MKNVLIIFFLLNNILIAQEKIFFETDKRPNCEILKNGKFISIGKSPKLSTTYIPKDYCIHVKDGIQMEYYESGIYVKSKIDFIDACEFNETILDVTIPNYFAKAGDCFTTKIIATQNEYIKMISTIFGVEYELLYLKIN